MSKACEQCEHPSNNKFLNCAPRMQDGRNFTDYRPRCIANFQEINGNKYPNSYEYRQYLVKNASTIMMKNRKDVYELNKCGPCMNPYNEGTMLPEHTIMKCNASTCSFNIKEGSGIGLGRDYGYPSEYNKQFLMEKEKEQIMLGAKENCCASVYDDQLYYPFDYKSVGIVNERPAVPSGAKVMIPNDRI
jgi:hypothetical protein